MLFCVLAILSGPVLYGCAGTKATTLELQNIHQVMQPAPVGGQSMADYTKVLHSGNEVSGNVTVSGEWEVPDDFCSPWTFEAWNPAGVLIDTATVSPVPFDNENPYYYFKFTATAEGKYIIRIIHRSIMVRYVDIVISPLGWQYESPQTF